MLEGLPRDVTLLIIEHDMDVVVSLADRVTVLHYGEVLTEGTFAEVKADPRVYEVYLGSALMPCSRWTASTPTTARATCSTASRCASAPGEAVALLGRNGAGKTTLIRSIVGFTPPRDGRVLLEGQAIQRWPAHRIARRGLALVPQGRRIFAPLTVRENLLLGARARTGWTLERVFELFPRLRERQAQRGRHALGRRAADAGHRPRAPDQRPAAAARRAVGGPGARSIVREIGRILSRAQGASASRSCWSSRTTTWPCGSPTAST